MCLKNRVVPLALGVPLSRCSSRCHRGGEEVPTLRGGNATLRGASRFHGQEMRKNMVKRTNPMSQDNERQAAAVDGAFALFFRDGMVFFLLIYLPNHQAGTVWARRVYARGAQELLRGAESKEAAEVPRRSPWTFRRARTASWAIRFSNRTTQQAFASGVFFAKMWNFHPPAHFLYRMPGVGH